MEPTTIHAGDSSSSNSRNVTVQESPINNFEEYGFTADFEGGIYENYTVHNMIFFVGYVWERPADDYPYKVALTWSSDGRVIHHHTSKQEQVEKYDLTPIVKEVYPMFKKNEDGEIFCITSNSTLHAVLLKNQHSITFTGDNHHKAVENYMELEDVQYDAKRGLYHGQPVYSVQDISRYITIYSVTDYSDEIDLVFEPIPLETLKTMPFIWEQYKAL